MTPTPSPAPPAAAAPAPRRRGPLARRVVGGVVLVLVGAGIGTAAKAVVAARTPAVAEPEAPATPPPVPLTDAERVDTPIRAGEFEAGLAACRAVPRATFGPHEGPLAYREALCLEGLGRHAEAAAVHARVAGEYATPGVVGWALLGQARCAAAAGDRAAAGRLVARALLTSGDDAGLLAECLHARARLALAAVPQPPLDPFDPTAIAWPATGDDLTGSAGRLIPPDAPRAADRGPVVVSRALFRPTFAWVTGRVADGAAGDAIRAVAAAGGLTAQFDPAVALPATGVGLDAAGAPLAAVLAALTEPHGAGWEVVGTELRVGPALPAGRADADAALTEAVRHAPGHPTAGAARLARANLRALAGRAREAAADYRAILANPATTPEAVPAAHNLGLAELRDGQVAAARARFLDAIDRAGPGTPWAARGWWWTGRAHLDAGDVRAAGRAFETAAGGPADVASAAVLGGVLCHLLDAKPDAARAALLDYRPARVESHAAIAAAVALLQRYRTVPSPGRADAVADAVRETDEFAAFGPAGALLAGRVYEELGRHDRAAAVFDAAGARARGPLAARMTLAAAERYADLGLVGPARQRYLAVAALDPTGYGARAELRLAELAADAGDGADCVRRCRDLLGRPGADRAAVLAVLGRGYELAGRYGAAAAAFAGNIPAE